MTTRKGILTPEQEVKIDEKLKFKNPVLELVDGPIVRTVDNILLAKLFAKLEEKYPGVTDTVTEVIDNVLDEL